MTERKMTWRVVALGSAEARDPRLGATATERLEMLAELSRLPWSPAAARFPSMPEAPCRFSHLFSRRLRSS